VTECCACHPIQAGERIFWEAALQDLSLAGLSLVAHRPFQIGQILVVQLPHPVAGVRDKLFVRVRHTRRNDEQSWQAGCSFINKLSADELQALLGAMPG
jgi:hypothetical protein